MTDSNVGPKGLYYESRKAVCTGMATAFCYATGFNDPGLISQIINYSSIDPREIRIRGTDVLCATQEDVDHVASFVEAASTLFPLSGEIWTQLVYTAYRSNSREVALIQSTYRAALLDALFAAVEGDEIFSIDQSDTFSDIVANVQKVEKRQASRPSRFTPIGMPTDDTQFLLSGLLCAAIDPDDFSKKIFSMWRNMGSSSLWRNSGKRLRSFIAGKPKALSGSVTLGDLLRFSAFSALTDEELRKSQFKLYCEESQLTAEQQNVGSYFLEAHSNVLTGNLDKAKFSLAAIERFLQPRHSYMSFFLNAVREELLGRENLVTFLAKMSEIGSDFDTFAFLGGLLLPRPALCSTDLPAMLQVPGTSVFSAILTYLFRNQQSSENGERTTEASRLFFHREFEATSYLQTLRSCKDADELKTVLRSSM